MGALSGKPISAAPQPPAEPAARVGEGLAVREASIIAQAVWKSAIESPTVAAFAASAATADVAIEVVEKFAKAGFDYVIKEVSRRT